MRFKFYKDKQYFPNSFIFILACFTLGDKIVRFGKSSKAIGD